MLRSASDMLDKSARANTSSELAGQEEYAVSTKILSASMSGLTTIEFKFSSSEMEKIMLPRLAAFGYGTERKTGLTHIITWNKA